MSEIFNDLPESFDAAIAAFDAAEPTSPDFMIGCWRGREIPTRHPLDGILEASGWWGKQFIDTDTVHPLLFASSRSPRPWALNPAYLPLQTSLLLPRFVRTSHLLASGIAVCRPILQTRKPHARLRTIAYRGQSTAAMAYDQLPIIDVFRKVTDDIVIGAMDYRHSENPYLFALHRTQMS
jgi:hypothetical protein